MRWTHSPTNWGNWNIFVGVATRKAATGRKLTDCLALHALFADLDFKNFPSEAAARDRLAAFPLPPSIVVRTGGGLQCYWLLAEPLDLQADAIYAKRLLIALATTIDDENVKAMRETARTIGLTQLLIDIHRSDQYGIEETEKFCRAP